MDRITSLAASGMRTQMETLDMLANNLANAGSVGFKSDQELRGVYLGAQYEGELNTLLPTNDSHWTNFSQGRLEQTGSSTDLALEGSGLFAVQAGRKTLYTRNGSFHLEKDGRLANHDGYSVLDANRRPIQLDPALPFEVAADGSVRQGGGTAAAIGIFDYSRKSSLNKAGHLYFEPAAGETSVAAASTKVYQGRLEASNVAPAESAVRLVQVMRHFEMLQKAIVLSGEMNRKSVEEVGRVGS